jgi:putative transposase
LERVRRSFKLHVYGYVVMPEHVHLLLSEPRGDTDCRGSAPLKPKDGLNGPPIGLIGPHARETKQKTLADALKSLKQGVSRRLIGDTQHFWQKRYYDFNIRNYAQFVEKLRYIHRNPVKAGLCERPEDWEWSSFRHYATGCEGRVEIESEWTARKRERAVGKLCPVVELPHSSQKTA